MLRHGKGDLAGGVYAEKNSTGLYGVAWKMAVAGSTAWARAEQNTDRRRRQDRAGDVARVAASVDWADMADEAAMPCRSFVEAGQMRRTGTGST
ncbi:hypothetical protein M0R45_008988 [Rubus argutus]|uniref:Uncharacterized protein n=1 Tax=Rubus argutus TaxID=59490 RepID=A0AAW1Y647_RUBAR